jgi:hypothetical protein
MKRRTGYNPKRRLAPVDYMTEEQRLALAERVRYGGNPEHKRSPGDYGLTPPASPRPGKTLCDAEREILIQEAQTLLASGFRKGTFDVRSTGSWPQNVWAISGAGEVFEAQLENSEQGIYHGYPLPEDDDFRRVVVEEWARR